MPDERGSGNRIAVPVQAHGTKTDGVALPRERHAVLRQPRGHRLLTYHDRDEGRLALARRGDQDHAFATARTRPVASTVAMVGSSVAQVTTGFGIGKRRLSLATATMRVVSAIAVSVSRLGVTIRNRTT